MTENSKKPTKIDKAIKELIEKFNKQNLSTKETLEVLPKFIFLIGAALENSYLQDSEEVLKRYAEEPTIGNALMAQALWMEETWVIPNNERETKND